MASSWEEQPNSWSNVGPSRNIEDNVDSTDPDNGEIDWDNVPTEFAEREFAETLITLKLEGELTATTACHLAFLAAKAGMKGLVEKSRFVQGWPRPVPTVLISIGF